MVTGDNTAIAREIAGQLGLGKNIQPATALFEDDDIVCLAHAGADDLFGHTVRGVLGAAVRGPAAR